MSSSCCCLCDENEAARHVATDALTIAGSGCFLQGRRSHTASTSRLCATFQKSGAHTSAIAGCHAAIAGCHCRCEHGAPDFLVVDLRCGASEIDEEALDELFTRPGDNLRKLQKTQVLHLLQEVSTGPACLHRRQVLFAQ